MMKNKSTAIDWIDRSFLSEYMKMAYKDLLRERYNQLGLEK